VNSHGFAPLYMIVTELICSNYLPTYRPETCSYSAANVLVEYDSEDESNVESETDAVEADREHLLPSLAASAKISSARVSETLTSVSVASTDLPGESPSTPVQAKEQAIKSSPALPDSAQHKYWLQR
jgi:hypothetical protein